eukprot:TRINITY_DN1584_c0_g9_i1.p3 TRINITY_DN1584_c0_g9~~TRINITY_DN1584_c0_g9_i1.p3  ORF type:complete len:148 (+),score=49.77 TRINITY_DN1584_c0_g9_i1:887-1330(+)
MRATLERNPVAFNPKIAKEADWETEGGALHHTRGCHCKKSGCLKKYCECFQSGACCTALCKCEQCKNQEAGAKDAFQLNQSAANCQENWQTPFNIRKRGKEKRSGRKRLQGKRKRGGCNRLKAKLDGAKFESRPISIKRGKFVSDKI